MAYTDVTTVKTYLGISSTADDALLQTLIDAACAYIDTRTRRTFEAAADTVAYYDASDIHDGVLYLRGDLAALTSVTNGDGSTVATSDVLLLPRSGPPYWGIRMRSSGPGWTVDDDIAVTGRWAYSTTAPADIAHAATRLAAWLYRQRDNQGDGDRVIVSPDGTTLMPSRIPNDVEAIIRAYARVLETAG